MKIKKYIELAAALILIAVFTAEIFGAAQSGCVALDTSFGTGGRTPFYTGTDQAVIQDASGRVLVTGSINLPGDMVLARFTASGALDTTFAGGVGYAAHNNAAGGNGLDIGYDLAIDGSGKIVVVGASTGSTQLDMAVWRYNSDGTIDTTFGTGGVFTSAGAAGGTTDDAAYGIAFDGAGRILVCGKSADSGNQAKMTVWRLNSNGTLDTTFGTTGYVVYGTTASGNDIAIDQTGKIIVGGYIFSLLTSKDMTVWKLNADGSFDSSFGTGGEFTHNGAAGGSATEDAANSVAIDSSGRIIASGFSSDSTGYNHATLWRLTSSGALDLTFNSTGFNCSSNIDGLTYDDSINKIQLDPSGKIVGAGYIYSLVNASYDTTVWRFNQDGTLDTTFNGAGYKTVTDSYTPGVHDYGYGLSLCSEGGILVAQKINTSLNVLKLKNSCEPAVTPTPTQIAGVRAGDVTVYKNVINPLKGDKAKIFFKTTAGERVKISVYNNRGVLVSSLYNANAISDGEQYIVWDGKNDNDSQIGSGVYIVVVETTHYNKSVKVVVVK